MHINEKKLSVLLMAVQTYHRVGTENVKQKLLALSSHILFNVIAEGRSLTLSIPSEKNRSAYWNLKGSGFKAN